MALQNEYRLVPDFPGYRVGDDGSVWTAWQRRSLGFCRGTASFVSDSWARLRPSTEKKTGYQCVKLRMQGRQRHFRVHVLVLRAFIGPRPKGMMGCHLDDDPKNNALVNLRWDSQKGNSADAIRNGRSLKGENGPSAKVTVEAVIEIRRRFASNESPDAIGRDFGLSPSHVHRIAKRHFWQSVTTEFDAACAARKLRPWDLKRPQK